MKSHLVGEAMKNLGKWIGVSLLGSTIGLGGCESKSKALPADQAPPANALASAKLGPGDELEIKFYYAPELNIQQRIRPDGKISLQLVGDVDAAGLTPGELDARLQDAFSAHLKYPELSVIVRGMYSRRVLVTGEVLRPGPMEMPAQMTLMEAIGYSGGFNLVTANIKQVIVSRDAGDGKRVGYVVNMKDEYAGAATTPFMLQPTDIVIVPRTAVVEVNQFMQQYINNNIPDAGVFYSKPTGGGSSITVDTRGTR